jgi:hypothetical protein
MLAGLPAASMYGGAAESPAPGDLRGKIVGLQRPATPMKKRVAVRHLGWTPTGTSSFSTSAATKSCGRRSNRRRRLLTPPSTLFARKAGMNFLVNLSDLRSSTGPA